MNGRRKIRKISVPSDLVALADLIHTPREDTESSEENGHGAGALGGYTTGVPNWSKTARRWPVLKDGHIFHASHSWLPPYHCFRHFVLSGWSLEIEKLIHQKYRRVVCDAMMKGLEFKSRPRINW